MGRWDERGWGWGRRAGVGIAVQTVRRAGEKE